MTGQGRMSALDRLAQTALAVAAVVFVVTAGAAMRVTADDRSATTVVNAPSGSPVVREALRDPDIERAIAHDLFSPLRTAPARRYTLEAGEPAEMVTEPAVEPELALELPVVHGTAVGANGEGFAMCAVPGGVVMVVRPGDAVGAFTVLSIERTRVHFRDPAGRRHTVDAIASPAGEFR